jgi:hypothetical protein
MLSEWGAVLAEAGTILGGERDAHAKRDDESENDHASSIGDRASLF